MKKKFKQGYLVIILILAISIGFAYLSATLNINGITNIKGNSWKIYFDNIEKRDGESFEIISPATSGTTTTSINYKIKLLEPGDIYRFNVDIVNEGTLDAMVKVVTDTELSTEQKKYTSYSVTYSDGVSIDEYQLLKNNSRETLTLTIRYLRNIEEDYLPAEDKEINVVFHLEYEQASSKVTARNHGLLDLSENGNNALFATTGVTKNNDSTISINNSFINLGFRNYYFGKSYSWVVRVKFSRINTGETDVIGNWEGAGAGIQLIDGELIISHGKKGEWAYVNGWSGTYPEVDKWYTYVYTFDGEYIRLYANGNPMLISPTSGGDLVYAVPVPTKDYSISNSPLILGANPNSTTSLIAGSVYDRGYMVYSDVILFERTIGDDEIAHDYGETINPTDLRNVLAYYDFS